MKTKSVFTLFTFYKIIHQNTIEADAIRMTGIADKTSMGTFLREGIDYSWDVKK
jgi:hypothetical protein